MSPRIGLDLPTLLQAAEELADTEGIAAVTLASLSQKLNIRSPSLYNHIDGLPDLRRLLALRGLGILSASLAEAIEDQSGDDAIRAFCFAYLKFARQHPGLYEVIQRAPDADDVQLRKTGEEIVLAAVNVLNEYGLEGEAALHAVRVIRSALHGFASLERQGGFGLPLKLDVSFALLIDTFLEGMKAMWKQRGIVR